MLIVRAIIGVFFIPPLFLFTVAKYQVGQAYR